MGDSCQFVKELRDDLQISFFMKTNIVQTLPERDSSLFHHCENYSVEHWRKEAATGGIL